MTHESTGLSAQQVQEIVQKIRAELAEINAACAPPYALPLQCKPLEMGMASAFMKCLEWISKGE